MTRCTSHDSIVSLAPWGLVRAPQATIAEDAVAGIDTVAKEINMKTSLLPRRQARLTWAHLINAQYTIGLSQIVPRECDREIDDSPAGLPSLQLALTPPAMNLAVSFLNSYYMNSFIRRARFSLDLMT